MDAIIFKGLRAQARIGAFDWEREKPQTLIVDLMLERDLSEPGSSDDLVDTIDYGAVTKGMVEFIGSVEVRLLEHLAEVIARKLLEETDVVRVTVEIAKLKPPITEEVDSVSVRIVRAR